MKSDEEKMYLQDVLLKLAEAEKEVREGKTGDARMALDELMGKYGI